MHRITFIRVTVSTLVLTAILGTAAATNAVAPARARSATQPQAASRSAAAAAALGRLSVYGGRSAAQLRSGVGAKLDAALAALARQSSQVRAPATLTQLRALNPAAHYAIEPTSGSAYVAVDAITRGDPAQLRAALVRLGMRHPAVYLNDVGGWLPVSAITQAATLTELHAMRASLSRTQAGAVTSQGDYVMRADTLRSSAGVDGTGITVGVLSDSYNCFAQYAGKLPQTGNNGYANNGFPVSIAARIASDDISSGDLPASADILEESQCMDYDPHFLPNGDEGRAMMQVVHDVAPGAKLAFHTATASEADFANGIQALANAGAQIIVDDVTYFDEPFFQDGLLAQAVDTVNAAGVAYFSAAGNSGSNGYDNKQPSFATASTSPPGEQLLNFDTSGGTTTTAMTVHIPQLEPGEYIAIVLEWDQPYVTGSTMSGGATSRMDLCITGSATGLTSFLINPDNPDANTPPDSLTNGGQVCTGPNATGVDPYQILFVGYSAAATGVSNPACPSWVPADVTSCSAEQDISIQVGLAGGTTPGRIKLAIADNGAGVTYPGPIVPSGGTLQGHPGAAGAMAVGAAYWYDTPDCGQTPALLEPYSAQAGDPILFAATTGARLAAPVYRPKPDIAGPDGGNDTFLGAAGGAAGSGMCANNQTYPNFFGTSAAAPHVAAVAALLLQTNMGQTPASLYAALRASAIGLGNYPNYSNFTAGYGFVQADAALTDLPAAPTVNLSLNPTTIDVGQSSTLTWSVSNADACTASGAWSGSQAFSGNLKITPSATGSQSYTLKCTNANGYTSDTTVLTVVSSGGGGGGGGGALDFLVLLMLAGAALARSRRAAAAGAPR